MPSARRAEPGARPLPALLAALALVAGCDASDGPAEAGVALDCRTAAPVRSAAEPLEWIPLEGVPDPVAPDLVVQVRRPGGDSVAGLTVRLKPRLAFAAPPHPGGLEGGDLEVRVATSRGACPFVGFTVLPLEPHPGAAKGVASAMTDAIHAQAALFGVTPQVLTTADPADLPPPVVPLALARAILDHPDHPESLGRTLEGTDPTDPSLRLLEAVWGRDGLAADVRAWTAALDSVSRDPAPGTSSAPTRRAARASWSRETPRSTSGPAPPVASGAMLASVASGSGPWVPPPPPQTDLWDMCGVTGPDDAREPDAAQLDCMMETAVMADIASTGEAKKIFELMQQTLKLGAILAKLAGARPLEKGYEVAGKAATVWMTGAQALAALLPSEMERFDVEVSPTLLLEDEPGPATITRMTVTAKSRGWDPESWAADEITKQIQQGELGVGLGSLVKPATDALKARAADNEIPPILAQEFGPTDVSDPEWSRTDVEGDAFQRLDHLTFRPRQPGSVTLNVRTAPMGYQVMVEEVAMEVRPIRVSVTPDRMTVPAGGDVTFTVEVENARDRSVTWGVTPGGHALVTAGEEKLKATLSTAEDPSRFPVRVRVESEADRRHLVRAPPRIAEARVTLYRIDVSPDGVCIQPGEERRFEAKVPETNIGGVVFPGGGEVEWRANAGRIDDDGRFRAPDAAVGAVTVTARSPDGRDLQGEAVIRVGGCDCWAVGTLGRPVHRAVSGVAHLEPGGGLFPPGVRVSGDILSLTDIIGFGATPPPPNFSVRLVVPGLADAGPSTLPVENVFAESTGEFSAMVDPEVPRTGGGTVRVTRSSEGAVEGIVTAWATVFSEGAEVLDSEDTYQTPLLLRFRAVTGSTSDPESPWSRCLVQAAGMERNRR